MPSATLVWVDALRAEKLSSPVYKPALLLVVLDLIDEGSVDPARVALDDRLSDRFDALLTSARINAEPRGVWQPFFHLGTPSSRGRPIWTLSGPRGEPLDTSGGRRPSSLTGLRSAVSYAAFAPDLDATLRQDAGRAAVRALVYDLLAGRNHPDATRLLEAHDREWPEVQRSASLVREASARPFALHVERPRVELNERVIRARDRGFRLVVLPEYQHRCAACELRLTWGALHESEAAHIVPVSEDGADDIRNALALCRTHHWAFDLGLWTVGNDRRIEVVEGGDGDDLAALQALRGRALVAPSAGASAPHPDAFAYHRRRRFKGARAA